MNKHKKISDKEIPKNKDIENIKSSTEKINKEIEEINKKIDEQDEILCDPKKNKEEKQKARRNKKYLIEEWKAKKPYDRLIKEARIDKRKPRRETDQILRNAFKLLPFLRLYKKEKRKGKYISFIKKRFDKVAKRFILSNYKTLCKNPLLFLLSMGMVVPPQKIVKMKKKYHTELEGQRDFYEALAPYMSEDEEWKPDYSCNTDGRIDGTLVEFKRNKSAGLPINQLKRYVESYNATASPIPQYSLVIYLNQHEYVFIDNENWKKIQWGTWNEPGDLIRFLNKDEYMKGWIDEYSIVAYNDKFYDGKDATDKQLFIKEIKNPKELYIEPYKWKKTGDMERSILDCLGGIELKKRLGAYFTPNQYVTRSTEYLRNTISRVPEGHDYVILDRCAGTGNLEKLLTPEELSHCILNTYVYAEWTTLKGLYEGRVRCIIPHTKDNKDPDGLLSDGDALTKEFDEIITEIIENERKKANGKLIVIGLENPPYSTPGAEATRSKKTYKQKNCWVKEQMKKAKAIKGDAASDICNHFIWSMKKYADEYIVYAPIKYWKTQHLFDGKFNEGYLCNRKFFHATKSAISLISWSIEKEKNKILIVDSDLGKRSLKKIKEGASTLLPNSKNRKVKNKFAGLVMRNGTPIGLNGHLINISSEHNRGRVREINKKNALNLLPLWVANCYNPKDYTEKEVIMKSGDGGKKYLKDQDFLDDCLLYACLTNKNKCISTDGKKNELCLNQNTKADGLLNIHGRHSKLLQKWNKILKMAETKDEANQKYTYGLHQIIREINIKVPTGDNNKKGEPIKQHKYPELNAEIKEFKKMLKDFYDKYITKKMFKYELLK